MGAGLIASIPSPVRNQVHVGPVPLRGYALCVIVAVVAGVVVGERRLRARGYPGGRVADIAVWGVPFGLVGARLDHVVTDHQLYVGRGRDWVRVFAIWDGGLSIWGALALGAVGAWIGCRRFRVRPSHLADAMAVGLPVAQAIGRWGNWFNQELYGRPSGLPWAVRIDAAHRLPRYAAAATYQPAFLYESLWDLGVAGFVLLAERRQWFGRLSRGRAFALYLAAYSVGRGWIEALRVDPSPHLLGLRVGDVIAIVVLVLTVGYLLRVRADAADAEPFAAGEPSTEPAARWAEVPAELLRPPAPRSEAEALPHRQAAPEPEPEPVWADVDPTAHTEPDPAPDPAPEFAPDPDPDPEPDADLEPAHDAYNPLDALRSPLRER